MSNKPIVADLKKLKTKFLDLERKICFCFCRFEVQPCPELLLKKVRRGIGGTRGEKWIKAQRVLILYAPLFGHEKYPSFNSVFFEKNLEIKLTNNAMLEIQSHPA